MGTTHTSCPATLGAESMTSLRNRGRRAGTDTRGPTARPGPPPLDAHTHARTCHGGWAGHGYTPNTSGSVELRACLRRALVHAGSARRAMCSIVSEPGRVGHVSGVSKRACLGIGGGEVEESCPEFCGASPWDLCRRLLAFRNSDLDEVPCHRHHVLRRSSLVLRHRGSAGKNVH